MKLEKLENYYYKNLDEADCEINSGTLGLVKQFKFVFDVDSSLSGSNTECTFDTVSKIGSLSSEYHSFIMKSYHCGAINNWNGTHSFKWDVSTGNYIPDKRISNNLIEIKNTLTSSVSLDSIAIISARMKYTGDSIESDSFEIFDSSSARMFYSTANSKTDSYINIVPDEQYFSSISSSLTAPNYIGWCLKDNGILGIWSSNTIFNDSLTAINNCSFNGTLYFNNKTANIVINQDEFNTTTNESFLYYNSNSTQNIVNTTYITSVGLWNKFGDLLIVAKPAHPIRKYIGVPISIKLEFDM